MATPEDSADFLRRNVWLIVATEAVAVVFACVAPLCASRNGTCNACGNEAVDTVNDDVFDEGGCDARLREPYW